MATVTSLRVEVTIDLDDENYKKVIGYLTFKERDPIIERIALDRVKHIPLISEMRMSEWRWARVAPCQTVIVFLIAR